MYKPLLTSMIKCTGNYNYNAMNTVTTLETVITVHKGSTVHASNYTSYSRIYTMSDGIPDRVDSNIAAAVKITQESRDYYRQQI